MYSKVVSHKLTGVLLFALQEVQATAKGVYLRSQTYQSGVSTLESLVASLRADKVCPRGDLTAMRTDLARIKEDYGLIVDEVIYKGQRVSGGAELGGFMQSRGAAMFLPVSSCAEGSANTRCQCCVEKGT